MVPTASEAALPPRAPRVRTWRRSLRALAHLGRARAAHVSTWPKPTSHAEPTARTVPLRAVPGPRGASASVTQGPLTLELGPNAAGWKRDHGPLDAPGALLTPRQGQLGDCWVIAAMLAVHHAAPAYLPGLLEQEPGGIVAVHLPGLDAPVRVDRQMPVGPHGRFVYARLGGGNPAWVGVLEKALAGHLAGGYDFLQRGFARYGLQLLLGSPVRTLLQLPDASQILTWLSEGRALCASTHPLSALVPSMHGDLPPSHVFAVVGAEPGSGHVHLRNPVRPARVLRIDARTFRRGFLSVDVSAPLA